MVPYYRLFSLFVVLTSSWLLTSACSNLQPRQHTPLISNISNPTPANTVNDNQQPLSGNIITTSSPSGGMFFNQKTNDLYNYLPELNLVQQYKLVKQNIDLLNSFLLKDKLLDIKFVDNKIIFVTEQTIYQQKKDKLIKLYVHNQKITSALATKDFFYLADGQRTFYKFNSNFQLLTERKNLGDFSNIIDTGQELVLQDALDSTLNTIDYDLNKVTNFIQPALKLGKAQYLSNGLLATTSLDSSELILIQTFPSLQEVQRYPINSSPWGLAYISAYRHLLVTETKQAVVMEFDFSSGTPIRLKTFPTIKDPNYVFFSPLTNNVIIGSSTVPNLQIIRWKAK